MDINAYIKPLVRWWRLIAVVTLLAIVASAVSTMFQPAQYVSRTTLMIGSTILNPNPDSGQISISQQLAIIYADMARREPIKTATMEALVSNQGCAECAVDRNFCDRHKSAAGTNYRQ
jgi:capsular polysaccharide biosynthesis protein